MRFSHARREECTIMIWDFEAEKEITKIPKFGPILENSFSHFQAS